MVLDEEQRNLDWYVSQYTTNLNEKIEQNPDNYVLIGRDQEINKVYVSLNRQHKNNPVLVGEAGVGKTAIIEEISKRIIKKKSPGFLKNNTVYSLNLGSMTHEDKDGNLISRMIKIIDYFKLHQDCILFVDELHTIMNTGANSSKLDIGNILKPALSRNEIKFIGATTFDEYSFFIEKDKALNRRMDPIRIIEPTRNETVQILNGLRTNYERKQNIKIDTESLKTCVDLSMRFSPELHLPDKAIDLLDTTCSRVALFSNNKVVSIKEVARTIQLDKNIPVNNILSNNTDNILNLLSNMKKRVKGQDEAIERIVGAIKIDYAGLRDNTKPISSFIFLGPTGVGKTETAKTLAKYLFGSEDNMIRFDMSEFQSAEDYSRLIGTRDKDNNVIKGVLTEAVKKKPYSILLFDEAEKANKTIFDLLLQVLDDGRITDIVGDTIDFRNTIIIMTTNIGAELVRDYEDNKIRSGIKEAKKDFSSAVDLELTRFFRKEFINRIDYKVVYEILTQKVVQTITENKLNDLDILLKKQGLSFKFDKRVIEYISDLGYDEMNGARPIARTIQEYLKEPLSDLILELRANDNKKYIGIKAYIKGNDPSKTDLNGTRELNFSGIY